MTRKPPPVIDYVPEWGWYFRQERHYITREELDLLKKHILLHGPPYGTAYISPYTVSWYRGGKKRTLKAVWQNVVDVLGRLPSEIARAHLEGAYAVWRPPYQKRLLTVLMREGYPPYYSRNGRYWDMAYVDLRAAYYVLYTRWWGLEYWPMRYLRPPMTTVPWDEELATNKLARNALYGLLRGTTKVGYAKGGKLIHYPAYQYVYPQLALAVVDTLHAIASQVIRMWRAVYVHTDGYIVPAKLAPHMVVWLKEVWGLEARIDAIGDAHVRGVGIYAVGPKATVPYIQGTVGRDTERVKHGVAEWLFPRYVWYSRLVQERMGEVVVRDRHLEAMVPKAIPLGY